MPMAGSSRDKRHVARLEGMTLIVGRDEPTPGCGDQDLVSRVPVRPVRRAIFERHRGNS